MRPAFAHAEFDLAQIRALISRVIAFSGLGTPDDHFNGGRVLLRKRHQNRTRRGRQQKEQALPLRGNLPSDRDCSKRPKQNGNPVAADISPDKSDPLGPALKSSS
jgi:hypothetical protein